MTDLSVDVTENYDASPSEVFAAWSNAEQIRQWWGPEGFTATTLDADVREGGAWRAVIESDEVDPLGQSGRYVTVEADRRLVFTFQWEQGEDQEERTITVTLAPDGTGTTLTFHIAPYASEDDRDDEQSGWEECLERLGDYLDEADD